MAEKTAESIIDVAIVGGGPAGLAAGLYAARSGVKTVLYEALFTGGQIVNSPEVANYPGFEAIAGSELTAKMLNQAELFGLDVRYTEVSGLSLLGDTKYIECGGERVAAKSVIVATGARPRLLGLDNEQKFTGAGVSYCAVCDGAFFRGKDVAVVGGGDTALTDALFLSRFCKTVYIIHRRDELRGSKSLQDHISDTENIKLAWNSVVTSLNGENVIDSVQITNTVDGTKSTLELCAVFVAIGMLPNNSLFKDELRLNGGYVIVDFSMQTNIEGVYAAGDVRETPLRQVVTAAADGAVAATSAVGYIS